MNNFPTYNVLADAPEKGIKDIQISDPKMSTFIYETANQFLKKSRNKKIIFF